MVLWVLRTPGSPSAVCTPVTLQPAENSYAQEPHRKPPDAATQAAQMAAFAMRGVERGASAVTVCVL